MMPLAARADLKMPVPLMEQSGRVTPFLFRYYTPLRSDSFGVVSTFIPFNPNITLSATYLSGSAIFPEYTNDLINLFNEVKLSQFDVTIVSCVNEDTKTTAMDPLAIGSITAASYSAPSNYATVLDCADAQVYPILFDRSGTGRFHGVRFRVASYAESSTPNPGSSSGISAGCPGAILLYADGAPASTQVGFIRYTGRYLMRTRA
jgi:hypothetical protein